MLIVAIADRPSPKSFGIVPFIARTDEGRLLVAGHRQTEIDEDYLQWLYRNPIGAHDVSKAGARLDAFGRGLSAGWLGDLFLSDCARLGAAPPETPTTWRAEEAEGRFWIGPRADIIACRVRWIDAAARQVVRTGSKELADLMKWANPHCPEAEAAVWFTRPTEKERDRELQRFSQIVSSVGERRRTKAQIEAEIRRTIARLSQG